MTATMTKGKTVDATGFFTAMEGEWKGRYHLWMMPEDPVQESDSTLKMTRGATGKWTMEYSWAEKGNAHRGKFSFEADAKGARYVWDDTFHGACGTMHGEGKVEDEGKKLVFMSEFEVAPDQPKWGWRTEFQRLTNGAFRMSDYLIKSNGVECLAVRCEYSR